MAISAIKCIFIICIIFFLRFANWRFFAMTTTTALITRVFFIFSLFCINVAG